MFVQKAIVMVMALEGGGGGIAYQFYSNACITGIGIKISLKYRRYRLPGGLKVSILWTV